MQNNELIQKLSLYLQEINLSAHESINLCEQELNFLKTNGYHTNNKRYKLEIQALIYNVGKENISFDILKKLNKLLEE